MKEPKKEEQLFQLILKLMNEHDNSELLMKPFVSLRSHRRDGALPELVALFAQTFTELLTHFQHEEKIIFPALLRVAPTPDSGIVVDRLSRDHRLFMAKLKEMEALLRGGHQNEVNLFFDELAQFESNFSKHFEEEFERVYLVMRNSHNMKLQIIQAAIQAGLLAK